MTVLANRLSGGHYFDQSIIGDLGRSFKDGPKMVARVDTKSAKAIRLTFKSELHSAVVIASSFLCSETRRSPAPTFIEIILLLGSME